MYNQFRLHELGHLKLLTKPYPFLEYELFFYVIASQKMVLQMERDKRFELCVAIRMTGLV